ncbi:MAG: hypothetical protein FWH55_04340 [Oscillospiraceae bacterium]|nr:hypothetical protein [Oscillospiraceae bacterium]
MNAKSKWSFLRPSSALHRLHRAIALALCLILVFGAPVLCISCKNTDDEDSEQEPEPIVDVSKELFFDALNGVDDYSASFGFSEIVDFFASTRLFNADALNFDEPVTSTFDISARVDGGRLRGDTKLMARILNDLSLSVDCRLDGSKSYADFNIKTFLAGSPLLESRLIADGERIGFSSSELYSDILVARYEDIPPIMGYLGLNPGDFEALPFLLNFPGVLEKSGELVSALETASPKFKKIWDSYVNFFEEKLNEDCFSMEETSVINGIPEKAYQKLCVTLTDEDLAAILSDLAFKLERDSELPDLFEENYSLVYNYLKGVAPPRVFEQIIPLTSDDMIVLIKALSGALKTLTPGGGDRFTFSAALYLDDKTVNCVEISLEDSFADEITSIFLKSFKTSDNSLKTVLEINLGISGIVGIIDAPFSAVFENTLKSDGSHISNKTEMIIPADLEVFGSFSSIDIVIDKDGDNETYGATAFEGGYPVLDFSIDNNYSQDGKEVDIASNLTAYFRDAAVPDDSAASIDSAVPDDSTASIDSAVPDDSTASIDSAVPDDSTASINSAVPDDSTASINSATSVASVASATFADSIDATSLVFSAESGNAAHPSGTAYSAASVVSEGSAGSTSSAGSVRISMTGHASKGGVVSPVSLLDLPDIVVLSEMTFLSGEIDRIEEKIQQNMNALYYRYADILLPYILY